MRTVTSVTANAHKKSFGVGIEDLEPVEFPFQQCSPMPSATDPIQEVFIDPELGNTGFTFRLESGAEGCVLSDHVLSYNRDPSYVVDLLLFDLSLIAAERLEKSGIGIRPLSRRLKTSPAQIYRLIDQTNYGKSIDQMVRLLTALGARVDLRVRDRDGLESLKSGVPRRVGRNHVT